MVRIAAACPSPRWHRIFLTRFLPATVARAKYAFRHLRGQDYQDAIQETIANALVAFVALVRRGKMSIAYPSVLARYATAQIKDGRRVGSSLNVHDVLSGYAQRLKNFKVESLDRYDEDENQWQEAVVQDTRSAPVFDTVAFRCDFADWLKSLRRRDRRIAESLSLGNSTSDVAKRFKVSAGRVSQLRRELADSWKKFTSDNEGNAA
ncbi:MAG: hypothetical protein ACLP9L_22970 [Thermoguttaceae bacterium]